jgi:hypothetical protein
MAQHAPHFFIDLSEEESDVSESVSEGVPESQDLIYVRTVCEEIEVREEETRKRNRKEDELLAMDMQIREAKEARGDVSEEEEERSFSEWFADSQQASQGESQRSTTRSQSQREEKRRRERERERPSCDRTYVLIYHDLMDLPKITPPRRPGMYADEFRKTTTTIGKYLIDLKFPIIDSGRHTICFLMTEILDPITKKVVKKGGLVAKVAIYDFGIYTKNDKGHLVLRDDQAKKHNEERNRDLVMQKYEGAFAKTEARLVSDNLGTTYKLIIQERLYPPFTNFGIDLPSLPVEDQLRLSHFVQENPDASSKWQYAKTADGRVVCYDYE